MSVGTDGVQKTGLDPLELHVVVNSLVWVLGTKLRLCARAAHVPNHREICPFPKKTTLLMIFRL